MAIDLCLSFQRLQAQVCMMPVVSSTIYLSEAGAYGNRLLSEGNKRELGRCAAHVPFVLCKNCAWLPTTIQTENKTKVTLKVFKRNLLGQETRRYGPLAGTHTNT